MKETRIHELARKSGGKFKLTVLLQKRLLEINRAQRYPGQERQTPLQVAMTEIEEGKITLTPAQNDETEAQMLPITDTFEE